MRASWALAAREALVVAFFLAMAAVATRPLAFHLFDRTLAGGDPIADLWTVNWIAGHVFEPARVFEGNMFHPAAHAVLFSDPSLGTAVLLVPLRFLTRDPVALYNLGVLGALAFGGWAFHLLARVLTGNLWAGLLAGTFAAFNGHQMRHVVYLNLLTIGWLALFLLGLHVCLERRSTAGALLAGVSLALTVQSTGYYAVAAVVLTLVFAAVHGSRVFERETLTRLALAAAVAVVLCLPFLVDYLAIYREHRLHRPLGMSMRMAFDPLRDLSSRAFLYRRVLRGNGQMFPGVVVPCLALLAVVRRRGAWVFYLASAVVLLVVSLGPELSLGHATIPMPYRWLRVVPPLDGMRHPVTFAGVALLALAALAALGWSALDVGRSAWAGVLVVACVAIEMLGPGPELQEVPRDVPPVYRVLETLPSGPVLELPVYSERALLAAARIPDLVWLNGQGSAFVPNDARRLDTAIGNSWLKAVPPDVDDTRAMDQVLDLPVRYLVLPARAARVRRGFVRAFERSRHFVLLRVAADGDRLYERCEPFHAEGAR